MTERFSIGESPKGLPTYLLDLSDDAVYIGQCVKGHEIRFALQNLRYQLLYESGAVALALGFHREAVASIATALERFLEFASIVLTKHAGVSPESFRHVWKEIATDSQRQIGAFLFLYLISYKKPFKMRDGNTYQKISTFRNAVIHKGKNPTRDEAMNFAQGVYYAVLDVSRELEVLCPSALEEAKQDHSLEAHGLLQKRSPNKKDEKGLWHGAGTAFYSMMLQREPQSPSVEVPFDEAFKRSARNLDLWGFAPLTGDEGDAP